MNILILAIHYPVASGRYMLDALRRMGHDAYSAGPCTGNQIWGLEVDAKYTWLADPIPDGWQPELVLIADSGLQVEKNWACPTVVYGVDNHVRDYAQFNEIADHFFLAHGHGARIGEPNVTWLPCGYDPAVFTPGQGGRNTDWSMLGVVYDSRAELLGKLLTEMPNLRGEYGAGRIYDEYARTYQNSKISIVRSAAGDVAQRVWETAAMGCLVIMDECADMPALGLEDGVNCVAYHSAADCVTKVKWALDNPAEAEQIAKRGQEWAKSGTWDARLKRIIDWVEQQSAAKPQKVVKK